MDFGIERLIGSLLHGRLHRAMGRSMARRLFGELLTPALDPMRLNRKISFLPRDRRPRGFLIAIGELGDAGPIDETRTARKVRDLWEHRDDPRRSRTYAELSERCIRGEAARKDGVMIDTPERVEAYCRRYLAIAEDMRQHGYRLAGDGERIVVAIDGNGEPVHLWRANHRVALARILRLPRVPVQIRYIDPDWVEACRRRYGPNRIAAIREGLRSLAGREAGA